MLKTILLIFLLISYLQVMPPLFWYYDSIVSHHTLHRAHWTLTCKDRKYICALLSHCVLHCIPQIGHFKKGECINAHFNMRQCQGCTVLCALQHVAFALCIMQCVEQCYVHCSIVKGGLLGQITYLGRVVEVGHWVSDLPGL